MSCRLNNKSMRNLRREGVYQAVMVDLVNLGIVSKEEAQLLGVGVPDYIKLPNGESNAVSEALLTKEPEPEPEEETVNEDDDLVTDDDNEEEPSVADEE